MSLPAEIRDCLDILEAVESAQGNLHKSGLRKLQETLERCLEAYGHTDMQDINTAQIEFEAGCG